MLQRRRNVIVLACREEVTQCLREGGGGARASGEGSGGGGGWGGYTHFERNHPLKFMEQVDLHN